MKATATCLALCTFLAAPASADEAAPLTAEAFEALTTGHTVTYSSGGAYYGTEQYLPGRRVIWTFGDTCQEGTWAPQGDAICFTYMDSPEPSCWVFRERRGGLAAWSALARLGEPLISTSQSRVPIACGPRVGV